MKQCNSCGTIKLLIQFYKNSRNKDEYHGYCKVCDVKKRKGLKIDDSWKPKVLKEGLKKCITCLKIKPQNKFYRNNCYQDGYMSRCKDCYNKNRHTKLNKHNTSLYRIKSSYGITEKDLQNLLLKQQGCCAICKIDFGLVNMHESKNIPYPIDHNHSTDKVRGLLCPGCNTYLGHIEKNKYKPEIFMTYLEETV